jgi:hypothetical protein
VVGDPSRDERNTEYETLSVVNGEDMSECGVRRYDDTKQGVGHLRCRLPVGHSGPHEAAIYGEIEQYQHTAGPTLRPFPDESRPRYILAIRAQALDRVQDLIKPDDGTPWPDEIPLPTPELWRRIVEAAFPPPPMA